MARIVSTPAEEISPDDAVHYQVIREALRKGNAAVMVGAGFSRNAIGGEKFATWQELAGQMAERLGLDAKASTADALRLAEQFGQVFGRTALDELLRQAVPDDCASPGKLHRDLLSLPWSEVFTTNYDRLLEWAAEELTERPYFTVCCREDIPQSRRLGWTRIVKLHGSFPSNRPFIITEEDYRTYPQTHAPFVNLVRQALLENVLCLIGFSGDDPNFLQWLGWVRDMLDRHSLPVYLFLSKAPSLGERRLLEARGVIPLCLPGLGDYAARYAALLGSLKPEKPAADGWGALPPPPDHSGQRSDADRAQAIATVYQNLKETLDAYPGWLVAPQAIRERFGRQYKAYTGWLGGWPRYREVLSRQSLVFQLCALGVLVKSQQVLLEPISEEQAELAAQLLGEVALLAGRALQTQLKDERLGPNACTDLWRCFRVLACAVLQWARQLMHLDMMERMKKLLGDPRVATAAVRDFIIWQDVQLELQQGDMLEAAGLLRNWQVAAADDYMLVRKAALLVEVGDQQGAQQICIQAVTQLRHKRRGSEDSVALSSCLAWASLVARHMAQRNFAIPDETIRRAAEPAQLELQKLHAALNAEASRVDRDEWRAGSFDLGFERRTGGSNKAFEAKCRAALNWLELAERIGSPPTPEWMQAVWWIQHRESFQRMLGILMRAGNDESLQPATENLLPHQQGWLSRCQLVEIEPRVAESLSRRLLRQLEGAEFSRSSFVAEVISRLLFRLDAAAQSELGPKFMQLCIRHPQWEGTHASLVLRVFESAPDASCDGLLAMLLVAADKELHWKISVARALPILRGRVLPESKLKAEALARACQLKIQTATSPLVAATEGAWRALSLLHELDMLPGAVAEGVAQWLWQHAGEGWPRHQHRDLGPWLAWEPALGSALASRHDTARQHLLDFLESLPALDLTSAEPLLLDHCHQVVRSLEVLQWTPIQFCRLLRGIRRLWDGVIGSNDELCLDDSSVREFLDEYSWSLDRMLATQLARTSANGKGVRGQQQQTNELIKLLQSRLPEYFPFWRTRLVLQRSRKEWPVIQCGLAEVILLDEGDGKALDAIQSLRWMPMSEAFAALPAPVLLLDALMGRLAARYPATLELDMTCVSDWLAAFPQWFGSRHISLLEALLKRLLAELDYRRSNRFEQRLPQEALPALRLAAARMAWLLIDKQLLADTGNAAACWLEAAAADPLPEMRLGRYRLEH